VVNATSEGNDNVSFAFKVANANTDYRFWYQKEYSRSSPPNSMDSYLSINYTDTNNIYNITGCAILENENAIYYLISDITDAIYYLISDITDSPTSKCMEITANNVTLDCQGHTIDGNGAADYGIYADNRANITIKNCVLTDWDTNSIFADSYPTSARFTIVNTTISSCPDVGVYLQNGYGFNLTNVNATCDDEDFDVASISSINCNNLVFDSCYGHNKLFYFDANDNLTIQNWNNNVSGFLLCGDNVFMNNITMSPTNKGRLITLKRTSNLTLKDSILTRVGLYLDSVTNSSFENLVMSNLSSEEAIYLKNSDNNNFISINITRAGWGVDFVSSDNNILKNTNISSSSDCAIRMQTTSTDNKIFNNYFDTKIPSLCLFSSGTNYWNTTKQLGTRIYSNGTYIGGNYYTNSTGNGYSDTCVDSNHDGFCDQVYDVYNDTWCEPGVNCSDNVDYLPLSNKYGGPIINSNHSNKYGGPIINSNQTYPAIPRYGLSVLINANVTSASGGTIVYTNFTLTSPNGTKVIDNENGTNYNSDLWNSSSYTIDDYGTWEVNITTADSGGYTKSSYWTFDITLGTLTVTTPDGDQNWTFSVNKTQNEIFNLTLSNDGNSNNTLSFSTTEDFHIHCYMAHQKNYG